MPQDSATCNSTDRADDLSSPHNIVSRTIRALRAGGMSGNRKTRRPRRRVGWGMDFEGANIMGRGGGHHQQELLEDISLGWSG